MDAQGAQRSARIAGVVTGLFGVSTLAAPKKMADAFGVEDMRTAYVIGVTDLGLAPGLLFAKNKRPWLLLRVIADVIVVALLAKEKSSTARASAAGLGVLAIVDARSASALKPAKD